MMLIGLGNTGAKYKYSLHNTGFLAIDFLKGKVSKEIVLAKTNCFMNDSGKAVLKLLKKAPTLQTSQKFPSFILIHDDIDIPLGKFKLSFGASSGGHKGVQSVIDTLGTKDFWRMRIGVQLPSYNKETDKAEDWVLTNFTSNEIALLQEVFKETSEYLKNNF